MKFITKSNFLEQLNKILTNAKELEEYRKEWFKKQSAWANSFSKPIALGTIKTVELSKSDEKTLSKEQINFLNNYWILVFVVEVTPAPDTKSNIYFWLIHSELKSAYTTVLLKNKTEILTNEEVKWKFDFFFEENKTVLKNVYKLDL